MKANELMIGDWVLINTYPAKVKLIGETLVKVRNCDNSIDVDDILPVPLTAEIIAGNGHPQVSIIWDDIKTEETGENWYEVMMHTGSDAAVLHIRYVHELQHALRLYGIWKKIEL